MPARENKGGKGEWRERTWGRGRKGKENMDRPPTSFSLKVALTIASLSEL